MAYVDACGKLGQREPSPGWLGLWSRVEGSLPAVSPSLLLYPRPPSVWLLLSCSAAHWPPQDEFSWLCQSCCHLFARCWSQQSGSASNSEQLGEWLPSLVISLAPLLCCCSRGLGSKTSCHLPSAGQPLLSPYHTPLDPSRPPQASASLTVRLQSRMQ